MFEKIGERISERAVVLDETDSRYYLLLLCWFFFAFFIPWNCPIWLHCCVSICWTTETLISCSIQTLKCTHNCSVHFGRLINNVYIQFGLRDWPGIHCGVCRSSLIFFGIVSLSHLLNEIYLANKSLIETRQRCNSGQIDSEVWWYDGELAFVLNI